jgi:hypothetical protein
MTVRKLPLTHVGNNVLDGEHGRALEPRNIRLRRLMVALQNGCYVGYGHLYFSSVNGGEKYIRLVTLTTQIIIKFSDQALDPRGPRRRPLASMHYGGWLRLFVEHLVCDPKIKGLETPFKQPQSPAKNAQNQHQNNGAQSKSGFVPKNYEKNEEKLKILEKWGFGFFVGKMGKIVEMGGGEGW